ncbi:DUF4817 domain-containing protein [Trichonephila clavipes]|uniref:DUF4817 domain-containing protein n=1 Tax=Trichonephila clavipes TaxID=2585209 RepID=A0A8X6RWA4_TRICX|nr:DUF4817 domain-containing protein [Trichonephila clavipes]
MMLSQEQIAIVEFYFAMKSHYRVINAFQQKYPGETAPYTSMIILLVQRLRDTGSVVDRKRSGRAFIMKKKATDVETTLQRSPLKRPSVCINSITEFISLLKVMKGTHGCSKTAQCVTHHETVWKFSCELCHRRTVPKLFPGLVNSEFIFFGADILEDDYIGRLITRVGESRQLARIRTFEAQCRDKTRYDARHRSVSYRPRELVGVFTPVRKVGLSENLLKRCFGPYRVFRKLSDVTYEIEELEPSP